MKKQFWWIGKIKEGDLYERAKHLRRFTQIKFTSFWSVWFVTVAHFTRSDAWSIMILTVVAFPYVLCHAFFVFLELNLFLSQNSLIFGALYRLSCWSAWILYSSFGIWLIAILSIHYYVYSIKFAVIWQLLVKFLFWLNYIDLPV